MTKRKAEGVSIDGILLALVPKIVDKNPGILRDTKKYWDYAEAQAHEFLSCLPAPYTAGLTEKKFKKVKSAVYTCKDSSIDLVLGFRPKYNLFVDKKVIACPLYDLLFKHVEPNPTEERPWAVQPTPTIIEAALKHFFVYQQDMDAGTLKAGGFKGGKRVIEDLPLLERFLPKGTIIEARTDCGGGVGEARYKI